ASLYASPAPPAGTFDSYLHEAGAPAGARDRSGLSWWSLLEMLPELDGDVGAWAPGSILFEGQGLAVLRRGRRYASLECGTTGGGHGHPDRLNLTLHDSGVHWLADPGAGSYVTRDLFWYRSTLAHNAPRIDGHSQTPGEAHCEYFDAGADWSWARGRWDRTSRTLVAGPGYLLDLVELEGPDPHLLELPWHLPGEHTVRGGRWEPAPDDPLAEVELVSDVERFTPSQPAGVITVDVRTADGASLTLRLAGVDELLRARGPGLPDTAAVAPSGPGKATFLVARSRGSYVRMTTLITSGAAELAAVQGDLIEVRHDGVAERHHRTTDGWDVELADATVHLAGRRAAPRRPEPLFDRNRELEVQGTAAWIEEAPALDGSLDGFDLTSPLHLDHDDQYRRSEEPYAGPESFSAEAWVNWSDAGLYLAVDVTTSDVVLRAPDAPPLLLDNERDEIHSAGIQVYLRSPGHGGFLGLLVVPVPETSDVRVLPVDGTAADADVARGGWQLTDGGYRITLAIEPPEWSLWYAGNEVAFDLLVNEMRPGRDRRSGQLVWSGGGGWVWLRGDRHDPARLRPLVLQ
ncbi:MAG: heparinase II/III family protein, partial [Gemmatimonadota bacterium]|nr:heparinase II/III family protein [Gemmatimonadota bacterium]